MDFLDFRWLSLDALFGVAASIVAYVVWGALIGRQRRERGDSELPEKL